MKRIGIIFLVVEMLTILLPITASILILTDSDIYSLRVFITDKIYIFFLIFIVILVLSFLIKSIEKTQKRTITFLALLGMLINFLLFDFILPY